MRLTICGVLYSLLATPDSRIAHAIISATIILETVADRYKTR